ncbi:RHS repeat-associated core domain-containing protein [Bosea sp. OK403]|uniref:RHS repeat-associated core domain-containing protein n=1 Tax=Bosea sp. OK403 TaxID=1855286 RepID=UPI0008E991B6|nr:RHS repeat-associated core domain-containing protein [Bosea sp. OK403]SFJ52107.1 RHS repeat-associated core domain-containing protein [Bosea sp. OK403]
MSYVYDLAGRVISVSDTGASLVNALPPSGGTVSFATNLSYDALNRPLAVNWNPTPAPAVAPTTSSVAFGYSYNQANQRIGQTTNDASWWLSPAAASTTTYTANNLDQYTAVGAVTPSYDGNGNLASDGSFTYAYDPENRLTGVMQGATTVASYDFDAQGRRKQKTVGSAKTVFVTDADNREVLEYDGTSGQVLRWYAYGLGSNEALNQIEVPSATRTSFIPDIQGSVQATLASATGTLAKAGYLPFGQSAASTGTFRYTGQRIDPETGLYYYRARMYAPALGRFLQPDPIGTQGGLNLYAYVGNDPLNLIDPWGWERQSPGGGGSLLQSFTGYLSSSFDALSRIPSGFRDMAQDAVSDPGLFLQRAEPALVGLGMSAPIMAVRAGALGETNAAATIPHQVLANRAAGNAFENAVGASLEQTGVTIGRQVTIQTQSGVRTRLDFLTRDSVGTIRCIECKASPTASLTRNQGLGFPEIGQQGGTVVGAGKPGFPGGIKIPPTAVDIIRGP